MILLQHEQYKDLLGYALKEVPNEACGMLGGAIAGSTKTVAKVYLLTNTDHSPEHFSMDPQEQFAAVKDMRENGWVLLGNWHSHPATPSRPSEEDRRLAFDPAASYLILSLMAPAEPVLKSFYLRAGLLEEEAIVYPMANRH
ncbi:MAG: M67 family metallopeptidase [Thermacetogeniaceae bacterium]